MTTKTRHRVLFAMTLGLITLIAPGCGYSQHELFRSDIKSVHVEIFESKEFRRDIEFWLTEAVKKKISSDTPYKLASREKADTILRGEILEERRNSFAPDYATRLPRDQQLTFVMRLQWKDQRSGQMLVDQPLLLQGADYLPPAGETEYYGQTKAIDRLATRIIEKMYADW